MTAPLHPLLASFPTIAPFGDDLMWYTFMGSEVRKSFVSWSDTPGNATATPDLWTDMWQTVGEELFEFIDLAEAAQQARGTFTVADIGAGYGRWLVYAELFRRAFNPSATGRYIGIEGDPTHYRWLLQHFRDNGLDPRDHDLRNKVVSNRWLVWFMRNDTPAKWYGQSSCSRPTKGIPTVPRAGISLSRIFKKYPRIDLVDADLQGVELEVFTPAIDTLTKKVARVHIGTHTPEIEAGLRELFNTAGWANHWDFPGGGIRDTPYGPVSFQDGAQGWINPRLCRSFL